MGSSLYRPPSTFAADHIEQQTQAIETACQSQQHVIWLGGDRNLPGFRWSTNSITGNSYPKAVSQAVLDEINDHGFSQVNHQPTRGHAPFVLPLRLFFLTVQVSHIPAQNYVPTLQARLIQTAVLHIFSLITVGERLSCQKKERRQL